MLEEAPQSGKACRRRKVWAQPMFICNKKNKKKRTWERTLCDSLALAKTSRLVPAHAVHEACGHMTCLALSNREASRTHRFIRWRFGAMLPWSLAAAVCYIESSRLSDWLICTGIQLQVQDVMTNCDGGVCCDMLAAPPRLKCRARLLAIFAFSFSSYLEKSCIFWLLTSPSHSSQRDRGQRSVSGCHSSQRDRVKEVSTAVATTIILKMGQPKKSNT